MGQNDESAVAERRLSGRACSTASCGQQQGTAGPSRTKAGARRPALASVLVGHFAGGPDLARAAAALFPMQADWLQQTVGTVNNVKHLMAGAISAVMSKTTTAPLERIKMEMQLKQRASTLATARQLAADGGWATFWRGNGMNLLRVTPHKAVNFYSFYLYRTAFRRALGGRDWKGAERFIAGACAGSTATLLCFPLDVVRTRMLTGEAGVYASAFGTAQAILRQESFASLYVGCLPAIVSTATSGAIFYGVYDILKERHLRRERELRGSSGGGQQQQLSAGRTMLYGALAGIAAESILYPLEVLRRRMQVQSMEATKVLRGVQRMEHQALAACAEGGLISGTSREAVPQAHRAAAAALRKGYLHRVMAACIDIYKKEGIPGFYHGIVPHQLQVIPSAALSYYFYEAAKRALKVEEE